MDRRRIWGVLILMAVTAAAAAVTYPETRAEQREAAEYRAFLDTAPVAQAEGDTESPDLRFRVETAGRTPGDLGELIYFFEYACGLSGYLLDVNPFDQPGVEAYKKNMFALLGKPGYEDRRAQLESKLGK